MAYRTSRVETPKRTADPGIVDDMVRQFADRYAFMRELVQNGIDAGATRIEARIERDHTHGGRVVTSVDDDGAGMTREIIEGPLLTLFSSSKEKDSTKIGKYGIGFVSVFAIEPDCVEVLTRRGAESWLVRLFGDHSYELLQSSAAPRAAQGTTVSLVQSNLGDTADTFEAHAASATHALQRWCRHARIPITMTILDRSDPASARRVDICEPMTAPGVVSLSMQKGDERFVVSVGHAEGTSTATFAGFYNRGLTLYETTGIEEAKLEGIRFKVDSPHLSHTLSRDNIKRDREYRRVLEHVIDLARNDLRRELLARLERLAVALAAQSSASPSAADEYRLLLHAAAVRAFSFAETKGIKLPLIEPIKGRPTIDLDDLEVGPSGDVLLGDMSTPVSRALAKEGHAVVHRAAQLAVLRAFSGKANVVDATQALGYAVSLAKGQPHDADLGGAVVRILKHAGRNVGQVRFAMFSGVGHLEPFRVIDRKVEEAVTAIRPNDKPPWGRSATLFLNVHVAAVRLARRRAKSDLEAAAHLLCRSILLFEGPLEPKIVDRLLEAAATSST